MTKPIVKHLTDFNAADKVVRGINRSQLDQVEMLADLSACKKPVWISCFFDGTGNNFDADGNRNVDANVVKYSNVAKLARLAHVIEDIPKQTYGLYTPGVGTPFKEIGDTGKGVDFVSGMAVASKGQARINWMINELKIRVDRHMPHVNQINVAVFGFSRGAAQARAFVRQLIAQCAQSGEHLLWTKSGDGDKPPRMVFYFLGLFDTVASVGVGGSRFENQIKAGVTVYSPIVGSVLHLIDDGGHAAWAQDLRIPRQVRQCEHYIAAHEVREKFPSDSVRVDQIMPDNCREILYPGAHSDVGGGYPNNEQEGRSNHLSRIALCNMYLTAYKAGVPFKAPEEVMKSTGELFVIDDQLKASFETYMSLVKDADRLEGQCISHMNTYYHWRWGRTLRQRKNKKALAAAIANGQAVMSATPEPTMTITDQEWESDVQSIAEKKTGFFRSNTYPHEDAIFSAWQGKLRNSLSPEKLALFDRFFDDYVHDSIAGFKVQVKVGEQSRWSLNRRYFMGKRDKKYLYWQYTGWLPETSGTREALLQQNNSKNENQTEIT